MIDFDVFKKSLGDKAATLTDDEIERRRVIEDRFADAFVDYWIRKKNSSKIEVPVKVEPELQPSENYNA